MKAKYNTISQLKPPLRYSHMQLSQLGKYFTSNQKWNRVSNFDPWPDPTWMLLTQWPDPIILTVCYWRMLSAKSLWSTYSTHRDHVNFQHNCKFIKYLKVKTKRHDYCNLAMSLAVTQLKKTSFSSFFYIESRRFRGGEFCCKILLLILLQWQISVLLCAL